MHLFGWYLRTAGSTLPSNADASAKRSCNTFPKRDLYKPCSDVSMLDRHNDALTGSVHKYVIGSRAEKPGILFSGKDVKMSRHICAKYLGISALSWVSARLVIGAVLFI